MALPKSEEMTTSPAITLGFFDTKGCRRWLSKLPLTNVPVAQAALLDQFARLQKTELSPLERAKIAELLRETVHFLHTKLARRYAQKGLPLDGPEEQAWQQDKGLWQALWQHYSACLAPILEGDPEIAPWAGHILHRGLHVGKSLVYVHALGRRTPPAELWLELHAYYRFSELRQCTEVPIKDKLQANASTASCYATYSQALLLELADPGAMSVRQIELTDRWLERWGRKVYFRQGVDPAAFHHVVDFKQGKPISVCKGLPEPRPESMRVAVTDALAISIQERLKRLETGTSPAQLNLGSDVTADVCIDLLRHLYHCWCTFNEEAPIEEADHDVVICGGGLPGSYFRIGNMTFMAGRPGERLSFTGTQMFSTLNVITGYDPQREQAERAYRWDEWRASLGDEETLRRSLERTEPRWGMEQLAVYRDSTQALRCGFVRWLRQDDLAGHLQLRLWHWDVKPEAMVLTPFGQLLKEDQPFPAIFLPALGDEPPSFIVPPRAFVLGKLVESRPPATVMKARFQRLMQRGADFERVAFTLE
jgi:hypothetical protein